jgi:hypothetical protein
MKATETKNNLATEGTENTETKNGKRKFIKNLGGSLL